MNLLWKLINYFVFLFPLYMSFVWIAGGLLFYFRWERKKYPDPDPDSLPLFSIIVPAHNEEEHIKPTITNLENLNYPQYEVIVVNDGSQDKTSQILDELAQHYQKWLKVIHLSPNSGKAQATNVGIVLSKGHFVLIMDADCFLDKDALTWISLHFLSHPRVGAVTGNPRVVNRTTLLGKIQVGEYSSIIGLIKRTQRILGKILTVSGVIAAFRKSAFYDCGLFDNDTVTEDIDMTWKLQKKFWDIRYEPQALCWVLVPETIRGLWRQRIRWAQGGVEVLKKHANVWLNGKQRRLWPIYTEYVISILWAHSFVFLVVAWLIMYLFYYFDTSFFAVSSLIFPVVPGWTGSILALVCLLQVIVSLCIDTRYESKSSLKYYFWAVWYPFFYWFLSALAIIVAVCNVFVRKSGVSATWESPDRGLHTLK